MAIRPGIVSLFLTVCTCIGCNTIDQGVNYTLFEPSSGLVHYRVSEGDELYLVLADGTHTQLKVAVVNESFITSEDGRSVAIDEIRELHNTYSVNLAQGTAAFLIYSVAGPLSLLALPVVIPMLLLYDEEAVENWQDDRLCRVSEQPDHYGFPASGSNENTAEVATLPEVLSEIGERELHCDAVTRAERYCAYASDSGTSFRECTIRQIPREQSGVVDLLNWTDAAICIASQPPNNQQALGGPETPATAEFAAEVTAEQRRRELDCRNSN